MTSSAAPDSAQPEARPALSIRNLRVDYGDFTAVDELDLDIGAGEIYGLAGPNGAGKTTTIRVLATLLEPTYGVVEVCGVDLFESSERIHSLLGYMPDLAPVVPDLKVWEFLDLYAHSHGYRGTEKRDRVDRSLSLVKLDDKRNVYGRGLSRGMMQRVVLAKTLLHDPKLLLLDEPASGMDPLARRDLRLILEKLASDGATVVVSSHILSELSGMCTSVGIMHLGRLVRSGPMAGMEDLQTRTVEIRLEIVGPGDDAVDWLRQRENVAIARTDGTAIEFSFGGDATARAALLRELLAAGFAVSAFTPVRTGIESMLMSVLTGDAG